MDTVRFYERESRSSDLKSSSEIISGERFDLGCICVWHHNALGVRVSGDEKRNALLHVTLVKRHGLPRGRAQQVAGLEPEAERGAGDFRDENIVQFQPPSCLFRKPAEDLMSRSSCHSITDQVPGQHVVPSAFEQLNDSSRDVNGGPVNQRL